MVFATSHSLHVTGSQSYLQAVWRKTNSFASNIAYNIHTIWLFTVSDFKTILGPTTAFALLHALGSSAFGIKDQREHLLASFGRLALVAFWTWINLLAFVVDNQRQLDGIEEDRYNKPWRPLPSGRVTVQQATTLSWALYPLSIAVSLCLGCPMQSLMLCFLGIWHNDFGGGDTSWLVRNFLNGAGYMCYTSGAFQLMLGTPAALNSTLKPWLCIIGCLIFSTIQSQDMYDQVGDRQRGRKTAPLVLGDLAARCSIAVPLLFWAWFCPRFWELPTLGYIVPVLLALKIAHRLFVHRSVKEDKKTFKMWNAWVVVVFTLPWMRTLLV